MPAHYAPRRRTFLWGSANTSVHPPIPPQPGPPWDFPSAEACCVWYQKGFPVERASHGSTCLGEGCSRVVSFYQNVHCWRAHIHIQVRVLGIDSCIGVPREWYGMFLGAQVVLDLLGTPFGRGVLCSIPFYGATNSTRNPSPVSDPQRDWMNNECFQRRSAPRLQYRLGSRTSDSSMALT